jgi:hypothetical protein
MTSQTKIHHPDTHALDILHPVISYLGKPLKIFDTDASHIKASSNNELSCLCCRTRIKFMRGSPEKRAHFSHVDETDNPKTCISFSRETYLHIRTKEVISELRESVFSAEDCHHTATRNRSDISIKTPFDGSFHYHSAEIEKTHKLTDRRPDVTAQSDFGPIHFEVCVTHPVDAEKEKDISVLQETFVEIFVKDILEGDTYTLDLNSDKFVNYVRSESPRRIIFLGKEMKDEASIRLLVSEIEAENLDLKRDLSSVYEMMETAPLVDQPGAGEYRQALYFTTQFDEIAKDLDEVKGDEKIKREAQKLLDRAKKASEVSRAKTDRYDPDKRLYEAQIKYLYWCKKFKKSAGVLSEALSIEVRPDQSIFETISRSRSCVGGISAALTGCNDTIDNISREISILAKKSEDMSLDDLHVELEYLRGVVDKLRHEDEEYSKSQRIKNKQRDQDKAEEDAREAILQAAKDAIDKKKTLKKTLAELQQRLHKATPNNDDGFYGFPPASFNLRHHEILGNVLGSRAANMRCCIINVFYGRNKIFGSVFSSDRCVADIISTPWGEDPSILFWALLHYEKAAPHLYQIICDDMKASGYLDILD